MAHLVSFVVMIWDSLMCSNDREMQNSDAFLYIIGMIAEPEPELKDYRC